MDLIKTGGKRVHREPGLTFPGRERSQGQSSEARRSGSLNSSSKLTTFDWTVSGKDKGEQSQKDGGAGDDRCGKASVDSAHCSFLSERYRELLQKTELTDSMLLTGRMAAVL